MSLKKSTKIVATISDMRCDVPFLEKVIAEGVNVVRMNSAHMSHEGFERVIGNVRQVSREVAILMDTKGPEVRTTTCSAPISYATDDEVRVIADPQVVTTREVISVNYMDFVRDVPVGSTILIDDGTLGLEVLSKSETELLCRVQNDGELGARKSINVPGVRINLPSLTEKDKDSILFSISAGVDFIAHSFVRNRQDVLDIQQILDEHGSNVKIIAKIENQEGIDNIDEIIDAAYGIMVARGDLGIEIDMEKIPALQSMIINKCILKKKPVIVATQMLHTMITSPRPTRAEVSDVSGAIMMNTDAVMLSGETAYGKYPIEAVRTMARIIKEAEQHKSNYNAPKLKSGEDDVVDVTSYLSKYAVKSVQKLGVRAIINDTYSGRTVRNLASYRGGVPIYAFCYQEQVARQLALSHGVHPYFMERPSGTKREYFLKALRFLMEKDYLKMDDLVVFIHGGLRDEVGTTSLDISKVADNIDFFDE